MVKCLTNEMHLSNITCPQSSNDCHYAINIDYVNINFVSQAAHRRVPVYQISCQMITGESIPS